MPEAIPLQVIPTQKFSIILEELRYELRFKKTTEVMVVDITRDGECIVQGLRCLPEQYLMPYQYQEGDGGNFIFVTENDELPDYTLFGVTQFLLYFTAAELEAQRADT